MSKIIDVVLRLQVKEPTDIKPAIDVLVSEMTSRIDGSTWTLRRGGLTGGSWGLNARWKKSADAGPLDINTLHMSVDDMGLTERASSRLKVLKAKQVKDVVHLTRETLLYAYAPAPSSSLGVNNFGVKSFLEIENWLDRRGLKLGMALPAWTQGELIEPTNVTVKPVTVAPKQHETVS